MDVLPKVATESAFALNGGTAINMFYQEMPRLSVNIDLTWLPVTDRSSSLRNIDRALRRIAALIRENNSGIHAQYLQRKRTVLPRIIVNKGKNIHKDCDLNSDTGYGTASKPNDNIRCRN